MKTTLVVLSGMFLGYALGTMIAPMSGEDLRAKLFGRDSDTEDENDLHTFNINELVSTNSSSLESIKEKIKQGS
jgi:hypothetical protein